MVRRLMPDDTLPIHPLRAGWVAARRSLVPGICIQIVMLGIVLLYFGSERARPFFEQIGTWKTESGYLFSFVSVAVAGGIFPEILRVLFFQKGRVERRNWSNLLFTIPFWGIQGLAVDLLYRSQAVWFGNNAHFWTIAKKVAVDQFLYNPLFAAPFGVTIYEWKNRGYQWSSEFLHWTWYRNRILPALVTTWAVWIPIVSIVYCLPSILQIPIFTLALTFWVTLFTLMSEMLVKKSSAPSFHV